MRRLIWFRNDLRVHDHPALHAAEGESGELISLYVISPRLQATTDFGFPKVGAYRTQFLRESLEELSGALARLGNRLILALGEPAEVIWELVRRGEVDELWFQTEVGTEEAAEESAVRERLKGEASPPAVCAYDGQTMYDPEALPFDLSRMPDIFTDVRKALEAEGQINEPLPPPRRLPPPPAKLPPTSGLPKTASAAAPKEVGRRGFSFFEDPRRALEAAGLEEREPDPRTAYPFPGGEAAALRRLEEYSFGSDRLARYKFTRNGLRGAEYSSKLSAWLANGSLSPRLVHREVRRYEEERKKNVSTYWLIFELTWRDYFNFLMRKYPRDSFRLYGPMRRELPWSRDRESFERWRRGETGEPFIDANMRELALTGYMSNRGRQNVASYLARDLGIDWRIGAEWFESTLIDYDPASNYGNWTYNSGVGTDPRLDRYFNPKSQAAKYDGDGSYRALWARG